MSVPSVSLLGILLPTWGNLRPWGGLWWQEGLAASPDGSMTVASSSGPVPERAGGGVLGSGWGNRRSGDMAEVTASRL